MVSFIEYINGRLSRSIVLDRQLEINGSQGVKLLKLSRLGACDHPNINDGEEINVFGVLNIRTSCISRGGAWLLMK